MIEQSYTLNIKKNVITLRYALGERKQTVEMCKADPTNEGVR